MASETDSTALAALTPEVWTPRYLRAMYSKPVASQRVLNVTGDVNGKGDILHISVEPRFTVGNVSSDGSVSNQTITPTDVQVTVNSIKHCTAEVVKYAQRQALESLVNAFPASAGKALMEQIDVDILALYSDVTTNTVGSSDAKLGEDEIAAAIQKLLGSRLDPLANSDEFTFVFADTDYTSLAKQRLIADASYRGEAGSAVNGWTKKVMGIPAYVTKEVATSSSVRKGLLFHREAFAWGAQRMPGLEKASALGAGSLSDVISCWSLYGVKTVRETFACLMNSKA